MHHPSLRPLHSISRPWVTFPNHVHHGHSILNNHSYSRNASSFQPGSLLKHEHLRGSAHQSPDGGLVPYETAEQRQELWRAKHLDWKNQRRPGQHAHSSASPPPPPVLLSFESAPIYTFGRQQQKLLLGGDLEPSLRQDLQVHLPRRRTPIAGTFVPEAKQTNRGGLTTYHGPGQLVLWPVLDLHSPLYAPFSASSYASHLESTTQKLLRDVFGIRTVISPGEPGVWVESSSLPTGLRKIAALGVHHRRYVAGLGTAINVDIAVKGDAEANPWARFVPCGIEGKTVTSVAEELEGINGRGQDTTSMVFDLEDLARRWAIIFEAGLVDPAEREKDPRR